MPDELPEAPSLHGWHDRKGKHRFYAEKYFDDHVCLTVCAVLFLHEESERNHISFCVRAHYDQVIAYMEGEHYLSSQMIGEISGVGHADDAALKADFEQFSSIHANIAVAQVRAAMAVFREHMSSDTKVQ